MPRRRCEQPTVTAWQPTGPQGDRPLGRLPGAGGDGGAGRPCSGPTRFSHLPRASHSRLDRPSPTHAWGHSFFEVVLTQREHRWRTGRGWQCAGARWVWGPPRESRAGGLPSASGRGTQKVTGLGVPGRRGCGEPRLAANTVDFRAV